MTKLLNKKAGISYLEILILMISIFAFCYILNDSFKEVSAQENSEQENKICCEKTDSGAWCQNTEQVNCNSDYKTSPVRCEETSYCELGCCYDSQQGICTERVNEAACSDGQWVADELCNIPQCEKACCLFGSNAFWGTEKECSLTSKFYGVEGIWVNSINNELECISQVLLTKQGACVYEEDFENNCIFTTGSECERLTGTFSGFHEDKLCSNEDLETICEPTSYTGCVEGRDEVYWFDSCGNRENIYEGSSYAKKQNSWNNGMVKSKEEVDCSINDPKDASNCGNCDYFEGSICRKYNPQIDEVKPEAGEYVCRSLNCNVIIDGQPRIKKNGESWCSFDGAIGPDENENILTRLSRDVVGSRYWKHTCLDGEEILEGCDDYRKGVCIEQEDTATGNTYAACKDNKWEECIELNFAENNLELMENVEKCEENENCWLKKVAIDDFNVQTCVPKYPPGFDIWGTNVEQNDSRKICNIGTKTCTVIYVKSWGHCECEINCDCLNYAPFEEQMNSMCVSLGDCGGYVNIEGKYSDEGYTFKQNGVPSKVKFLLQRVINKYKTFANPLLWVRQIADYSDAELIQNVFGILNRESGASGGGMGGGTAFAIAFVVGYIAGFIAFSLNLVWLSPIISAVVMIILFLGLASGVCKKVYVTYECRPWQPETGVNDCDACNNQDKPCSKYRCQSLGSACEFLYEGTEHEICINTASGDTSSPVREPLLNYISEGHSYKNIQDNGFQIYGKGEKNCIQTQTNVEFGIETNENAICKYDVEQGKEYDEMIGEFENIWFNTEHKINYNLPSVESLANYFEVEEEAIKEKYGVMNFYVKCKDVLGNTNQNDYIIRTCVSPIPDETAPVVKSFIPESGSFVRYDADEKLVTAFIDEQAECRWSKQDKDYEIMENQMSCNNEMMEQTLLGWPCNVTFTNLIEGENQFFIRCKDKPWLNESDEKRKTMTRSKTYVLKKSASELVIDSLEVISEVDSVQISKNEDLFEIMGGLNTISAKLTARTSGGAEDGKSICEWEETEKGWSDQFSITDSNEHETYSLPLNEEQYNFEVTCKDAAGNTASENIEIHLELDNQVPWITRAFFHENKLKVMTNENSQCSYSNEDCNFIVSEGTKMSGQEKEHSITWKENRIYYIKCRDEYGNAPGECNIVIRTYDN